FRDSSSRCTVLSSAGTLVTTSSADAAMTTNHNRSDKEAQSRALLLQVKERSYSLPKRERILQWQAQQDFPICPDPEDPNACNVYKELRFPDGIYDHIHEYWEEKVEAQQASEATLGS